MFIEIIIISYGMAMLALNRKLTLLRYRVTSLLNDD